MLFYKKLNKGYDLGTLVVVFFFLVIVQSACAGKLLKVASRHIHIVVF